MECRTQCIGCLDLVYSSDVGKLTSGWDLFLQMHETYIEIIIFYQGVAHKGHAKDIKHHSKALLWHWDSQLQWLPSCRAVPQ